MVAEHAQIYPDNVHRIIPRLAIYLPLSAGDLFSVPDKAIVSDLTEVVNKICEITSLSDYVNNDNDQSVVEICITRVTSAIRETGSMQQHAESLVCLLESCLNHSLKPSVKDEDPPHAKIAADIISCLFLNYSKKDVMERALPVAVKFLHKGNRELSRNMSSYLSLAAIENADLLARHIQLIIDSILAGNYPLCRVLPQVYAVDNEPLHAHAMALVSLLPLCENPEKLALLSLFALIATNDASLLEPSLAQLAEYLGSGPTAAGTMQVFLNIAATKPQLLVDQVAHMKRAAERHPNTLCLAAQAISLVGKLSQDRAQEALDFVLQHLPKADRGSQGTLLREATLLCTSYPVLFTDKMLAEVRHRNTANSSSHVNQTSGGVTIVKVGGGQQNSSTQTQPQPQYTPGGRPTQSDSAWPNRLLLTRPRLEAGSRSTGRLHASAAHRSMTRLNMAGGSRAGSVGGALHKSLTRLSSSQQINSVANPLVNNNRSVTTITGSRHYSVQPAQRVTSGGVTVVTKQISKDGELVLPIPTSTPPVSLNMHSSNRDSANASLASLTPAPASTLRLTRSGPVSVAPVTTRRHNTSVTLLNGASVAAQRMSVFEPYPMRDTVQHFCEKHLDKIKSYMDKVAVRIPPPAKCTIEERRAKKLAKLHFACAGRGEHCLYSRTLFTMRTRHPRVWIHLMFLALQARCQSALSSRDASVSALKNCWDILKCENKTFLTLVTSAFPCTKDQDLLLNELRHSGFFDVFECCSGGVGAWGCFLCNHPERAVGFLQDSQPVIEGQLQEKKGRWKLFRRWRTRYFTLSGAHLTYKGSKDDKEVTQFEVNQIRSVKVSRGARNIPKAFEIFTGDQSLILKPKGGKNAEEWVQCLSIVVAHSHAREMPAKTNSLPARRTAV